MPQDVKPGGRGAGCFGLGPDYKTEPFLKESALIFPDRNTELDFSTFLNIMYRQMKQEEPEKEILTALSMIDTQKRGVITVSELRAKLTRLGEKLSEEEGIFQLKDVPNAPHLPISFPIFLCSQIWDEALPAGRPTAAGESAGAPLVWGEKGCPPIVPKMSTRVSRRAIVSPGPPHPL